MIRLCTSPAGKAHRNEKECEGQHIQSARQDLLLLPYILMVSGDGDNLAGAGMSLGSPGWFNTTLSALLTFMLSLRPFSDLRDFACLLIKLSQHPP